MEIRRQYGEIAAFHQLATDSDYILFKSNVEVRGVQRRTQWKRRL